MNVKDFQRMFTYDAWANREVVASIKLKKISTEESVPADTLGRIAHILAAQKLWLERVLKQPQSSPVWPDATIEDCAKLTEEMSSAWGNYLERLGNQFAPGSLSDTVEYRNSKGEPWSSSVEDVLMHVLFHSAYHRGQIALQMRAAGFTPAYTDFIHAVRQGLID